MDPTETIVPLDEIADVMLNNLLEAQLSINNDEDEDLRLFEEIVFSNQARTYAELDQKSSKRVVEFFNKSDQPKQIKCSHCLDVFSSAEFNAHVCTQDENHQPIPMAITCEVKPETELQKQQRITMQMLKENQLQLSQLTNEEKKKSKVQCFKCCRKFVRDTGLDRHYDLHIGELMELSPLEDSRNIMMVTLCLMCSEVFWKESDAWEHIQMNHIEVVDSVRHFRIPRAALAKGAIVSEIPAKRNRKDCDMDKASTNDPLELVLVEERQLSAGEFIRTVYVSMVFQCEYCDSVFYHQKLMLQHESNHVPSTGFSCNACELSGLSLKQILIHRRLECVVFRNYRNYLKDFPRVWICNVCNEEFRGLEQLINHRYQLKHMFPRIEPEYNKLAFMCEFCVMHFPTDSELVKHKNVAHLKKVEDSDKEPKTSERVKKLGTNRRGGLHQVSTRERDYLCDVCGKSYTQSSHLWQHLRFHQGVKPFKCSYKGCDRSFTIRPDLDDHIRKCHTGERPFVCLVCNKRFLTGSVYYQHRLIHRGERRYGCIECGKRFYRADALKNHSRIHSGEKPYVCTECHKAFRQRGDRDKHFKVRHPGVRQISSPKKQRIKSFGQGRVRDHSDIYKAKP